MRTQLRGTNRQMNGRLQRRHPDLAGATEDYTNADPLNTSHKRRFGTGLFRWLVTRGMLGRN